MSAEVKGRPEERAKQEELLGQYPKDSGLTYCEPIHRPRHSANVRTAVSSEARKRGESSEKPLCPQCRHR